jgi:hypothetical protein
MFVKKRSAKMSIGAGTVRLSNEGGRNGPGKGEIGMRVMVIVKASKESEAGALPDTEMLAAMGRFNEELVKAGIMKEAAGLRPSSLGKRVRYSKGKAMVTDGPFAETRELVGGFWIWEVKSVDEAVEWLKRAPFRDEEVEVRPFFEMDDLGEGFTPELREREQRLREEVRRQGER